MKISPQSLPFIILGLSLLWTDRAFPQGSLTPPGAPAPTMKTLDEVEPRTIINSTNTPGDATNLFIINAPGTYYLKAPINVSTIGISGIRIGSSNVTVDLCGFAVQGGGRGTHGIVVTTGSFAVNVVIRNGFVNSWTGDGISAAAATNLRLEKLLVNQNTGNGIVAGEGSVVSECLAVSSGTGHGIVTGANSVVTHCTAEKNNGANAFGISTGNGCLVSHCSAYQNNGTNGGGINVGVGGSVVDCTTSQNNGTGGAGISANSASGMDASVMRCNSSLNTGTNGIGILAASRVKIGDCLTAENAGDGIKAAGDCMITNNASTKNAGIGIHTTATGNRIDGNSVTQNTGFGIKVDGANSIIIRNTARGNNGGGANFGSAAGNGDAAVVTAGTAFTGVDPWANFSY